MSNKLKYNLILTLFLTLFLFSAKTQLDADENKPNQSKFDYNPLLIHSKDNAFKKNTINRNNLSEDSLNISRILWRLKTPFIKSKMDQILKEIAYEKKLIDPYPVDFYLLNPNKRERSELGNKRYIKSNTIFMPVEKIIDSLSNIITRSVILRINKIDYEMEKLNIGLIVGPTFDNSYLNLSIFPDLKNKEKLRSLLFETILKSDKKRSFEWIWGKSLENDAYYSTKLTAFNGAFTIYLEYRTFIGQNSFRDKNSWFFQLADYGNSLKKESNDEQLLLSVSSIQDQKIISKKRNLDKSEDKFEKKNSSFTFIDTLVNNENKQENIIPFTFDSNIDTLKFNVFQYSKVPSKDKYYLNYEKELSISKILDSLGNNIYRNINIIKTDNNTNLKFNNSKIIENKNYNETIFVMDSLSFFDKNYMNKIKTILAQAYNQPLKRKTLEFIIGKSKSGYSYYALVITVFNGQLTVFNEYRKNAKRDYYIDKKGWFSHLPIFNEEI